LEQLAAFKSKIKQKQSQLSKYLCGINVGDLRIEVQENDELKHETTLEPIVIKTEWIEDQNLPLEICEA
jgi:hypothetical protein